MINTLAIVPLRGGSKSIPKKNIRPIAGKPLCYWVLKALVQSKVADKIVVSTDCDEIVTTVRSFKLNVQIIERPSELATDTASTESVILHAFKKFPAKTVLTIQATSPLTTADDFIKAKSLFINGRYDSLLTGVRTKRFFWDFKGKPLNYNPLKRPMRQEFAGSIMENGAFYFTKGSLLKKLESRLGGKIGLYEMSEENLVEIDEPQDWIEVENLLCKRPSTLKEIIKKIKLVIIDVDGTLTDGGMYYSENGEALKKFNTTDGKGIERLHCIKIKTCLLTSENSLIAKVRGEKLKFNNIIINADPKTKSLKDICKKMAVNLDETAYIGDDLNDLEAMKLSLFRCCPLNARQEIKDICHYISPFSGGQGAVRDICELIIKHCTS